MATDASQARQLANMFLKVCSSRDNKSWDGPDGFLATEALGTLEKAYADMGEAWLRRAIEARLRGGEAGLEAVLAERIEGSALQALRHVNYVAVLRVTGSLQELRQLLEGVVHHSPKRAGPVKQIFRMLKTKEPDLDGKITLKVAIPGEGTQGRKSHYLDVYPVNDAFDDLQWYQQLHAMAFYMKGSDSAWHWHFNLTRDAVDATPSTRRRASFGKAAT